MFLSKTNLFVILLFWSFSSTELCQILFLYFSQLTSLCDWIGFVYFLGAHSWVMITKAFGEDIKLSSFELALSSFEYI